MTAKTKKIILPNKQIDSSLLITQQVTQFTQQVTQFTQQVPADYLDPTIITAPEMTPEFPEASLEKSITSQMIKILYLVE